MALALVEVTSRVEGTYSKIVKVSRVAHVSDSRMGRLSISDRRGPISLIAELSSSCVISLMRFLYGRHRRL